MPSEQRVTKVKFDGGKVRIEYQRTRDNGEPDEYALMCADKPAPEFGAALQALAVDVVAVCELAESDLARITVRGVTITHTNEIMGACVTALKALKTANALLVLNTPHLPSDFYSGEDNGTPLMSDEFVRRVEELVMQADRYIAGDRAQGNLFGGKAAA
jgi:hypothetical protein